MKTICAILHDREVFFLGNFREGVFYLGFAREIVQETQTQTDDAKEHLENILFKLREAHPDP